MNAHKFTITSPIDAEALHAAIDAAYDLHPYSIQHESDCVIVLIEDAARDPGRVALEQIVRVVPAAQPRRHARQAIIEMAIQAKLRRDAAAALAAVETDPNVRADLLNIANSTPGGVNG